MGTNRSILGARGHSFGHSRSAGSAQGPVTAAQTPADRSLIPVAVRAAAPARTIPPSEPVADRDNRRAVAWFVARNTSPGVRFESQVISARITLPLGSTAMDKDRRNRDP